MNYALIFAGGTGQRMNTKTLPKQFLELHSKAIIIHTLEQFSNHFDIDGIVVVCVKGYIEYLKKILAKSTVNKITAIIPGGETGQESIWNGIKELYNNYSEDTIVLIHDGVRPLIDQETITENILCVKKNGNAITVAPATETIVMKQENSGMISEIADRDKCYMARAPQSFYLSDLYKAHKEAKKSGKRNFVDTACLMHAYGHMLYIVEGPVENIKITTPTDYYIFRAVCDAKENSQIFGL